MASLRDIKKDINYLTGEVVSDCFLFLHIHEGKKQDEIVKILNTVVDLRNELITKVNSVPEEMAGKKKVYYRSIYNELLAKMDEQLQILSKIAAS